MYFKQALVLEEQIFSFGEWTKLAPVVSGMPFHLRNLKNVLVVNTQAFLFGDVAGLRLW